MKTIAGLLLLSVLAGCATLESARSEGPLSRAPVYRELSSRDSLFPMLFIIDGRPVSQLQPGEMRHFELPAGDHEFAYELGVYYCSARVRIEAGTMTTDWHEAV